MQGVVAIHLKILPSLKIGSSNKVYIRKFKKEHLDYTIGISILVTSLMNADFDGDELNFTVLGDLNMARLAENFDPYYSVPGLNNPYEISGLLNIPKPTVATLSNFLTHIDNGVNTNSLLNEVRMVEVDI